MNLKNCMNQNEKINYINKINKKYNYDEDIVKMMTEPKITICDGTELKQVKLDVH